MISDLTYNELSISIDACYSGNAIEYLNGANRTIFTSSEKEEKSNGLFAKIFTSTLTKGTKEWYYADFYGDSDGNTSLNEGFIFTKSILNINNIGNPLSNVDFSEGPKSFQNNLACKIILKEEIFHSEYRPEDVPITNSESERKSVEEYNQYWDILLIIGTITSIATAVICALVFIAIIQGSVTASSTGFPGVVIAAIGIEVATKLFAIAAIANFLAFVMNFWGLDISVISEETVYDVGSITWFTFGVAIPILEIFLASLNSFLGILMIPYGEAIISIFGVYGYIINKQGKDPDPPFKIRGGFLGIGYDKRN